MHWMQIGFIVYLVILVLVCLRIIFETHDSTKTLAYLLFCIFVPGIGIGFYLCFGINYWRIKRYSKKTGLNDKLLQQLDDAIPRFKASVVDLPTEDATWPDAALVKMLTNAIKSPLTRHNKVKLLLNGEEKFPELMECMANAKYHIHIEYYIFEQDDIGSAIIELLIKKANEGVEVRFIYDDFGCPSIKRKIEHRMRNAGIEIHPFQKVHFYLLANRINYRNHRKIVVIDGQTGFTGGINVSDRYINNKPKQLYWRDTHLRIDGPGVYYLQYLFLADWSFCCGKNIEPQQVHFPEPLQQEEDIYVQVVGSGPDSVQPSILFSILQSIYLAKNEILITTPYFIPGDNVIDALRIAACSGLSVKMLVPGISDSKLVNGAARTNYTDLLKAGVEIYLYKKGFVHAKTMITDGKLSFIGTANTDYRSFDLNFEVNAMVYDQPFAMQLREVFFDDLKNAEKIDADTWYARKWYKILLERFARLFSPAL